MAGSPPAALLAVAVRMAPFGSRGLPLSSDALCDEHVDLAGLAGTRRCSAAAPPEGFERGLILSLSRFFVYWFGCFGRGSVTPAIWVARTVYWFGCFGRGGEAVVGDGAVFTAAFPPDDVSPWIHPGKVGGLIFGRRGSSVLLAVSVDEDCTLPCGDDASPSSFGRFSNFSLSSSSRASFLPSLKFSSDATRGRNVRTGFLTSVAVNGSPRR
mmetsp:Transcript_22693/g.56364  ORF Transcript_22693/g.56364 Transcript_22693/m.56364 type:complete len:212 (+) Transcript_22693:4193-4828(+)